MDQVPNVEVNFKTQLFHGKQIVPFPRNQGKTETCFIQSACTCTESLKKRRAALKTPPEDFEVILSTDHLIGLYEQEHGLIGKEHAGCRGFARLVNTLEILKKVGVPGIENEKVVDLHKISSFEEKAPAYSPKGTKAQLNPKKKIPQDILKHLSRGHAMIGTFRISKNYKTLKPGEIYVYDRNNPLTINNRAGSHAVSIIGYGAKDGVWYYVFQNSYGEGWGQNGVGRVSMESLTHLVKVKI